jgi:zinc protease
MVLFGSDLVRRLFLGTAVCLLFSAAGAQVVPQRHSVLAHKAAGQPAKFFPYPIHEMTLANGLHILIVPTPEFKDMVSYTTTVFAGSRNETEKGKTGLAHLFEHIMFRHEYGGVRGGYEELMNRIGTYNNAWTNYDMTFYHPFTFAEKLVGPVQTPQGPVPGVIALEASRFKGLKLDHRTFQVEAGAVLGEYRRIYSFPVQKMIEQMSPVAFPNHPYGHTVIGYLDDVEKMPQSWDAAWQFFRNYYTPNDVAIIVVGDVNPQKLFPAMEKAYADWKPAPTPKIPAAPEPKREKPVHVEWQAEVAPRLMVAYHTPPFVPGTPESAVGLVLDELLTSRSAPLYRRLRYQKQSVTSFDTYASPISTDPHWMLLGAELSLERFHKEGTKYVDDVRTDILNGTEALKDFSKEPGAVHTLEVIKSKVKNDFLGQWDTTDHIAQSLATFYRFNRDARVLDTLLQSVEALQPADIDDYAAKYLSREGRLVGTLWHGTQQPQTAAKKAEGR